MQVSRGTVYLRGGTWTIGYTVGGHRMREAIGSNRQLAEAVLKKRIVEAIEDRHFNKRNVGRVPFSEFAETYKRAMVDRMEQIWARPVKAADSLVAQSPRKPVPRHNRVTRPAVAVNA